MDIEGKEDDVLRKVVLEGVLCLVDRWFIEWHSEELIGATTTALHTTTTATILPLPQLPLPRPLPLPLPLLLPLPATAATATTFTRHRAVAGASR